MDRYIDMALTLANSLGPGPGGKPWTAGHIADYESMSDGCSGRLSWLYALAGRKISCHKCCVIHDFLYHLGGNGQARFLADLRLKMCAADAGSTGGWLGRAWRVIRADVMFVAVRLFGGLFFG